MNFEGLFPKFDPCHESNYTSWDYNLDALPDVDDPVIYDQIEDLPHREGQKPLMPLSLIEDAPIPLQGSVSPCEPYPTYAFGALAPGIRLTSHYTQTNDAMVGTCLLSALAQCAQSIADIDIDGRSILLSLFSITIAGSGERKGAVDNIVNKPIRDAERDMLISYDDIHRKYLIAYSVYEQKKKSLEKKYGKDKNFNCESYMKEMQELYEPEYPPRPILMIENGNIEGIYKLLLRDYPSIIWCSSEAGIILGGIAFNRDNLLKTAATLSSLWSTGVADKVRSVDGASKIYGRRVSLSFMIQPAVAAELLFNEVLESQGLLARCLITQPPSLVGTRFLDPEAPQQILVDQPDYQKIYSTLSALLDTPLNREDSPSHPIVTRKLTLDAGARAEYVKYYNEVELELSHKGKYRLVVPYANRSPEQALRIAGLLTLADNPTSSIIDVVHMQSGITLARWYLHEILRLRSDLMPAEEIIKAEQLLTWLQRDNKCTHRGYKVFDVRMLIQYGPRRLRAKKILDPLIKILSEHRWIERAEGPVIINDQISNQGWILRYSSRDII